MIGLLTYKLGMMSIIDDQGIVKALTLLRVKPNFVSQIKSAQTDGYEAIQIAVAKKSKVKKTPKRSLESS